MDWCLIGLLGLAVLVVFSRCFGSDLVFDSHFVIGLDTRLREFSAKSISEIWGENYWWPSMYSNLYRPVTTQLFNIQYSVLGFGEKPPGYQLVNMGLHFLVVALAYRVLLRLGMARVFAFMAAGWLAVHPYVTEVVPNVVGLSDLLAMLVMTGGMLLYLDIVEGRRTFARGGALLLAVMVTGVLAKENAVALIALIVWHALVLAPARAAALFRSDGAVCRRRIAAVVAALALVAAAVAVPKLVHKEVERVAGDPTVADNPLRGEPPLAARVNALAILGDNMVNCLVPTTISADYSYGQIKLAGFRSWDATDFRVLALAAGVCAFGVCGLLAFRRWPEFSFAAGAAFIVALPTSNILVLIGTIRADRLVYPLILPMAVCTGLVVLKIWARLSPRLSPKADGLVKKWTPFGVAGYVAMIALVTNLRATDWRTTEGFWRAAYQTSPDSFKTKMGWAGAHEAVTDEDFTGDIELIREAMAQLEASPLQAVRENDGAWEFLAFRLGARARHFLERGETSLAERDLREALDWWNHILDFKKIRTGRLAAAYGADAKILEKFKPKIDDTLAARSEIQRYFGEAPRAVADLREYYADNRTSKNYLKALGRAEADAGNWEEGVVQLLKVVLMAPDDVTTSREAAALLANHRLPETAKPFRSTKRNKEEGGPLLNIADPRLDVLGKTATESLLADLRADGATRSSQELERQIRARLGRAAWLPAGS